MPPSSTASGSYKGRPPPPQSTLSSSSAFCPTAPPFPPLLSRCGQLAPASLRLFQPCLKHRAAVYNLSAPRAIDHHPRTPPPPSFPSGRPHLTVELILLVSSSFPPPQNGSTTLPPFSPDSATPRHQALTESGRATTSAAVAERLPCPVEMGHQLKWLGHWAEQAEPFCGLIPSAQCTFSIIFRFLLN
jgi:hypothetical protein